MQSSRHADFRCTVLQHTVHFFMVTTHAIERLMRSQTSILYIRWHITARLLSQVDWATHTEYAVNLLLSAIIKR